MEERWEAKDQPIKKISLFQQESTEVKSSKDEFSLFQDALRENQGLTDAIFNSLTANIAVIDKGGNIVAVNATWERFARENGAIPLERTSIGVNYLRAIQESTGEYSDGAKEALAGIQELLEGSLQEFNLEYPCHSPTEKRWFLLYGTPLASPKGGAVLLHIDITRRKLAEETLQEAHNELERRVEERTADLSQANQQLEREIEERKQAEMRLQSALMEVQKLKDRLEKENVYLREEIKLKHQHKEIIGQSEAIKQVLNQVEQVAGMNSTVLIMGETGTGKELIALAIHQNSTCKEKPMVKINCAALPSTLLESELFGREKGAYTGALSRQAGRFEIADGSTIFLDEIGDLPLELQGKLLRVLESGEFERLGSSKTIRVNVRIIAATNRDLAKAVRAGKFREDLYYRLNVFPIKVPPLRERLEDISILAWAFIKEFQEPMGKRIETISRQSLEAMQRYPWPGNIRELRNLIEHAMIISQDKVLKVEMPEAFDSERVYGFSLEEVERKHILSILEKGRWRIRGKGGAAEILGLNPTTLYSKMKKLGIQRLSDDISTFRRNKDE
jgi:transcriptional regulator with GAF, ATPase, and Fis domain